MSKLHRRMLAPLMAWMLAGSMFCVRASSARAATPAEVDAAVEKARKYILSQKSGDNFEIVPKRDPKGGQADVRGWQWGGLTGIAAYGLLASGMSYQDPELAPVIAWLSRAEIHGFYASAMRAQVWTFLPEKQARIYSISDYRLLMTGMHQDAQKVGFYPYYADEKWVRQKNWMDRSVSQISVLGVWACEQAGQDVSPAYWRTIDASWKAAQKEDGGWNYRDDKAESASTATMTAAGVATLYITQDYLLRGADFSKCNGAASNENLEKGMDWIDKNAEKILHGGVGHAYYALYGMERIGVASGRRYFGATDWYKVGAETLVRRQSADGSWGNADENHNARKIPDTVFATLFLVRGRAPVVINKLEYDTIGADGKPLPRTWNQRPRDVANLTHWSGKQLERYLNWQIVNLKAPASELRDAPIMYISGSRPLTFTDEEAAKLRQYVEEGGLILGNADCGDVSFTRSFSALGQKLFPKYEFRELPENHVIYTDEQFRPDRWKEKQRVMGLSNGVRELMLLIPESDLGRAWQVDAVKNQADSFELMQDIYLYAVDKSDLRNRGVTHILDPDEKIKPQGKLTIARVMAGENPNPEPYAWRRMAGLFHNQYKLDLDVKDVKLGDGSLLASGAKLAHLTGTTKLVLSSEQREELKAFVARGGTVVIDAAGGSSDFGASVEAELTKSFGGTGEALPPAHPLYDLPNARIEGFNYRNFARSRVGRLNAPRLRGVMVGGRIGVLYSPDDLTEGMVGQPIDGVAGYKPDTATAIMRNIVLAVGS